MAVNIYSFFSFVVVNYTPPPNKVGNPKFEDEDIHKIGNVHAKDFYSGGKYDAPPPVEINAHLICFIDK